MQIKENLHNYVLLKEKNKKKLLKEVNKNKKRGILVVYEANSEEMLRFALEKTTVDIVIGVEKIHPKEHTHYPRSGLDQVLCKIAAAKGKTVGFDFSDILNSAGRGKLLARMRLNIKLCKKYHIKMLFTNLSKHPVSLKNLTSFYRVIEKEVKF